MALRVMPPTALCSDAPHAASDVDQLVDGGERGLHHGVGSLRRDVAVITERDADRGGLRGARR